MEPVNLIVTGRLKNIKRNLKIHGWYVADPLNFKTFWHSLWSMFSRRPYRTGPMFPGFIDQHHRHDVAFERPTYQDNYRQRHHLRLWKTRYRLGKQRIWVGIISFDKSIGIGRAGIPTHHIHPSLLWEEKFLAHCLGVAKPLFLHLGNSEKGFVSNGDPYVYDGRALVLDFSRVEVPVMANAADGLERSSLL